MKFNIEQWLESHRKQCASEAKNMGIWFSSANQDLFIWRLRSVQSKLGE